MAAAAGPANPPLNPLPPAVPVIPLPDDVFLQELGHANKSDLDYGAADVAWYNLGLQNVTITSEAQFLHYARALVQRVRDPLGTRGGRAVREQARRRRLSIVLMALRTTLGYQRLSMNQLYPENDFPCANDVNFFPIFRDRLRGLTHNPPLAPATISAVRRLVRQRGPQKDRIRAKYYARRQELFPSAMEKAMSRIRQFSAAETAKRFGGFTVRDGNGQVQTLLCTHAAYRGEGNSLWHVLAAQLRGRLATGGVNLGAGRLEKSIVFGFLEKVLITPTHCRHLMYCQMQAISPDEIRQRYDAATVRQLWEDWGEMSLLRCLAVNDPDGGPPKDPQFKGVFQLISDIWRVEVLVWVGVLPSWGLRGDYELHVFGPRSYGLYGRYPSNDPFWNQGVDPGPALVQQPDNNQRGGRGQLVFVTDPTWTHYDLPANIIFPYDTSHKTNADRWGWLGLPFLNQNGPRHLGARHAPAWWFPPVPAPWRTFAEQWAVNWRNNEQTEGYLADFNVHAVAPADSRMFAMPDAATRAGWTQEIDWTRNLLGYEPWSITSGCYRDPNRGPGDNSVKWGRFENKSAYEIHRLKAKLTSRNLPWEPRSTTTIDDEIHLQ